MTDSPEELSPLKRALIEIRELRSATERARQRQHEPIAIVGMGLRFPGGASDRASFWRLLKDRVDATTEVPADRWDRDAYHNDDADAPGKMVTKRGGFLDDVDKFDASFFGISHREAASMDPQQRMLLTTAWEALEDADIPPDSLFGTNAGVFVGIINSDYFRMLLANVDTIDSYAGSGNVLSVASGRISYVLGIEGPSISYDTACSSSLVSVHAAVQSLRQQECNLALAGGVNLILSPELTINHSKARMMAPDGRCKTFDSSADGYGRSEGCGMIALKRLSDARADGDRVLAVIRGSAVNQDGRSGGLTAPNGPSQERVIASALAAAELTPADVSYVEAHGTGTPLGDPIEVGALRNALCADRPSTSPLLIGSVKTNVGHTEAAAGIAGLIKTVLMLDNDEIAPNLHLSELNPHLSELMASIDVPLESKEWKRTDSPRVAGVSSFGLSGTNAHVIVSDPPAYETGGESESINPTSAPAVAILPISATDDAALAELAIHYADRLDGVDLSAVETLSQAAALGRSHLSRRLTVVGSNAEEIASGLRSFASGAQRGESNAIVAGPAEIGTPTEHVAFLFTGHGSHYPNMGAALYRSEPIFAATFDRCVEIFSDRTGHDLRDAILGSGEALQTMTVAQPALFSLQLSLAALWSSWGVTPTIVAGHSVGEYAAAVTANALSIEDGLLLVAERGRLFDSLPEAGSMAALFVAEDDVSAAVAKRTNDVSVAAVNGPTSVVISGRDHAIKEVIAELALDDDEVRWLDVPVAAHSPLIDPILDAFSETASRITMRTPDLALVSSMTGQFTDASFTAGDYWRNHLRSPVRFGSVFETLRDADCGVFLELGPHNTLIGQGQRAWPNTRAAWASSLQRDIDDDRQIRGALGVVHNAGIDVDWEQITAIPRSGRPHIVLPLYPWQQRSYWAADAPSVEASTPSTPRWDAANAGASRRASSAPLGLRIDAYPDRWTTIDQLSRSAMNNTFVALGVFADTETTVTAADLVESGRIDGEYEAVVGRWLEHLTTAGVLHRHNDRFAAVQPLAYIDLDKIVADFSVSTSGIEPLLDYLLACASALVDVLTGAESPLATLFPDGKYDIVDFLYHDWDILAYYNSLVAGAVSNVASTRKTTRILEVGAGTGGTTAWVLPEVSGSSVDYHFTDVSDFFLTRARERFAEYNNVSYGILNLEQTPEDQGYEAGSFDVILASNVLHATSNLDQTLQHVRHLLAPGGVVIALEGTTYPMWADVSTGLIEGWQLFDDGWREDEPLISAETWRNALMANGFTQANTYPADDDVASALIHHVIVGQAPGDEHAVTPAGSHAPTESSGDALPTSAMLPTPSEVSARLETALPDERLDILVDTVRAVMAAVLRTPDPASLARDLPLLDLGFDSLMAVELRNLLRETIGLKEKLPATLVFDRPTIRAIAEHVDSLLQRDSPSPDATAPAEAPADTSADSQTESVFADIEEDDVEAALLAKLEEVER